MHHARMLKGRGWILLGLFSATIDLVKRDESKVVKLCSFDTPAHPKNTRKKDESLLRTFQLGARDENHLVKLILNRQTKT